MIRIKISQLGDHLLREAIAEVLLTWVTGEILERKYREHQPSRLWLRPGRGAVPHQQQPTNRYENYNHHNGGKQFLPRAAAQNFGPASRAQRTVPFFLSS